MKKIMLLIITLFTLAMIDPSQAFAADGTWSTLAPMTLGQIEGGGVINGQFYGFGLDMTPSPYVNRIVVYNPSTNAWTTKSSPSQLLGEAGVAAIGNNIYVVGGCAGTDCRVGTTNTLYIYDSATDTWTSGSSMPTALNLTNVAAINGLLYVAGGSTSASPVSTLEVYDPTADTWTTKAAMPGALRGAATGAYNNMLYVAGGANSSAGTAVSTLYVYSISTDSWATEASMPGQVAQAGGAFLNGLFYVTGGYNSNGSMLNTMYAFNPATASWATSTPMPTPLQDTVAGAINGTLYVAGLSSGANYTTLLAYTPSGSSCSYSISPGSQSFSSSGGTGSITVTPSPGSCSWNASANVSWITITSGSSGTGNGTVSYSVSPLTGTNSQTGTITIAGQTFSVTQNGVQQYTLTITNSGKGNGTVTSSSGGISCGSTCSASFTAGAVVTLTATPSSGSAFTGWSGSVCSGTGSCAFSLNSNTTVTATFNTVMTGTTVQVGSAGNYYTIQSGYDAAGNGSAIQVQSGTYWENDNLNNAISVALKGGYDSSFSTNSLYSTIYGTLTIGKGTVTAWNIIIQSAAGPTPPPAPSEPWTPVSPGPTGSILYITGTSCPVASTLECSQQVANGSSCFYQSCECFFSETGVGDTDSGYWKTFDASGNLTGIFDCELNGGYTALQIREGTCSLMYSSQVQAFINSCACTYSLSSTSQSFTSTGGTGSVGVTTSAGCSWTATSNASWITVTPGSSGSGNNHVNYTVAANTSSGNGNVTYTVAANTNASQRTGTMTIAGQTFTVTQSGYTPSCTYTLSPTSQSYNSSGGQGYVNVGVTPSSGCNWTAASNASWITINYGSSGSGNGSVAYIVAPNSSTGQLTGTITIAGQTFTVTQAGSCPCALSSTSQSFGWLGGTGSVSFITSSGCNWAATSNVSWITITGSITGSGNGVVNYMVAANTSTGQRTGAITIGGQTFTVTQAGQCTYTLSSTSQSFDSSGGQGSVGVTPSSGCSWTATSNVSWITITSGSSGSGNGVVNYTVAANASTSQITGIIWIGDSVDYNITGFTVTQAGAQPPPPPPPGGGYYYFNFNCNGSAGCISILGQGVYNTGSIGPFCSLTTCTNWANEYNLVNTCSTSPVYTVVSTLPAGVACE